MVMPSLWVTSGEAPAKERFANVHYRKAFLLPSSGKTRLGQGCYSMAFRVLIIGGTGQVGAAVVRALLAEPSCAEVVMVNRKAIPLNRNHRLRQVILDTAA